MRGPVAGHSGAAQIDGCGRRAEARETQGIGQPPRRIDREDQGAASDLSRLNAEGRGDRRLADAAGAPRRRERATWQGRLRGFGGSCGGALFDFCIRPDGSREERLRVLGPTGVRAESGGEVGEVDDGQLAE